jgi:acetoin utilization deacetylase AcuC-like enzyme
VRAVYSPRYHIDIGAHVFPTIKYQLVQRALAAAGGFAFVEPEPASWDDLALVHTGGYLHQLREGEFSPQELMALEVPWSPEVVEGFRLMTGGTLLAARDAMQQGIGMHIGGGFHHAFANHGEGFCLFNDVAVAIRLLQRDALIRRAVVIDCDVHHGNGTAMIFDGDPDVFTFSIHQQHNYPVFKPRSALDIGLDDRTGDEAYLSKLGTALPKVFAFKPDVVFYLAGADPYEDDQLGGLSLTQDGLRERDRLVFTSCRKAERPVVLTLAGGYARRVSDTVAIHAATFAEAVQAFSPCHD